MSREKFLTACGWAVHLYTALGAVAGLLAIDFTARGDFRGAFILMAAAVVIDSSDGPLARAVKIRERIPILDGALLDNLVDYINYVLAPVYLMIQAGIISNSAGGLVLAGFVIVASAYGFCRVDAKTEDNYFRGFPSYWNLVAFYLFCLRPSLLVNAMILIILGVMVFVPIKYIYPNRTEILRPVTITLGLIWAVVTLSMLPALPAYNPILLYISLAFIAYYFVTSFVLHLYPMHMGASSGAAHIVTRDG